MREKNHLQSNTDFHKLTKPEQEEQNHYDLRQLFNYYESWDKVRELIDRMEEYDEELGFERHSESRYYGGDGNFAANH